MPKHAELQPSKPTPPDSNRFTRKFLANYYQFPILEAAEELHCCASILKKECRRIGINRWPHRVHKALTDLTDATHKSNLNEQLKEQLLIKLEQGLNNLEDNPNAKLQDIISKHEMNLIREGLKPTIPKDIERPTLLNPPAKKRKIGTNNFSDEEMQAISILNSLSKAKPKEASFSNSQYGFFSQQDLNNTSRLYFINQQPAISELRLYKNSYIYCNDNLYFINKTCDSLLINLFNKDLFKETIATIPPERLNNQLRILTPQIVSKAISCNTLIAVESLEEESPGII
jgi:hypothetical protein